MRYSRYSWDQQRVMETPTRSFDKINVSKSCDGVTLPTSRGTRSIRRDRFEALDYNTGSTNIHLWYVSTIPCDFGNYAHARTFLLFKSAELFRGRQLRAHNIIYNTLNVHVDFRLLLFMYTGLFPTRFTSIIERVRNNIIWARKKFCVSFFFFYQLV